VIKATHHIGILATVIRQSGPISWSLIAIEPLRVVPEPLFHNTKYLINPTPGFFHPRHERVSIGKQDESQAIAMIGAISHLNPTVIDFYHPGIAGPIHRAIMVIPKGSQAVSYPFHQSLLLTLILGQKSCRHSKLENKSSRADQMTCSGIIDFPIIQKELEVAPITVIKTSRVIESKSGACMLQKEVGGAEIWGHVKAKLGHSTDGIACRIKGRKRVSGNGSIEVAMKGTFTRQYCKNLKKLVVLFCPLPCYQGWCTNETQVKHHLIDGTLLVQEPPMYLIPLSTDSIYPAFLSVDLLY